MSYLKTTWKHIRRSPYQAFSAVIIMMLTFFVISMVTFTIYGFSKVINYFESKPQVAAFFKNETKQEEIEILKEELRGINVVSKIDFISKENALKIYKKQNQDDPLLLELVTSDILPASLEISTKKIEDLERISNMLKKSPIVSEVIYQKDVISTLTSWTNIVRKVGAVLVGVLSLVSMVIIITIIGIKISRKKDEIEIMRLIGATNWYIRWPFIFEGVFYGAVGAFLGWAFASSVILYFTPFLSSFLKGTAIFPLPFMIYINLFGAELLMAILLGALSSFLAVLRYLK